MKYEITRNSAMQIQSLLMIKINDKGFVKISDLSPQLLKMAHEFTRRRILNIEDDRFIIN